MEDGAPDGARRLDATLAYHPPATPGAPGRWTLAVAGEGGVGGLQVEGATPEEALRRLRAALAAGAGAGETPALRVRAAPGLALDPGVCGGRIHLEGTEITLSLLLETLAEEGSFARVREHFPILGDEDLAGALRFAARALAGLSARP